MVSGKLRRVKHLLSFRWLLGNVWICWHMQPLVTASTAAACHPLGRIVAGFLCRQASTKLAWL